MSYNAELAQVNDRVARLAARLAALDGLAEEALHPAVLEDEASAAVVATALEQLPRSRVGRAAIAAKFERGEVLAEAEARELMAAGAEAAVAGAGADEREEAADEAPSPRPSPRGRGR